jgi:hypothetical protein
MDRGGAVSKALDEHVPMCREREAYLEKSVDVGLLGILLGHALVLVPGLPLVLAGEVCCASETGWLQSGSE